MTFACTYAGQPVCLDHDGRLVNLLDTRWPDPGWLFSRERMSGAASPFFAGGINDRIRPPYPALPQLQLNELIVPTGASRYTRGLFIVDNVRLKQIVYDAYGYTDASATALASLPANWDASWTAQTLSIVQGGATFSWPMYLLPPVILDASGSNTLWLLPLVDARFFWQSKGFEAGPSAGTTWDGLVASLTSVAAPLSGTLSAHADYGTFDPETFADKSITVGAALDVAALSLGRRIVFDGTSIDFQAAAAADTARAANLALSGLRLGGTSPGTIKAESPRISCRYCNDHWPDPSRSYDLVPAVNNTGTSAERPSIRSAWYVEHRNGSTDGSAMTAAQAFADRLATDLLAWGNRQYIASFAGIANWTLSGHDDYLSIRIHDDIGGAAAIMRVASLPHSFRPTVNLCQRPGIYIHPNETATGTLTEKLAPAGSADLMLDAVSSLYTGSPGVVSVQLSAANPGETLEAGSRVLLHYQSGIGWRAIAPPPPPASSEESVLVAFRLDGPLSSGMASATVEGIFATDPTNAPTVPGTITVTDPQQLFRYGIAYSRGWAWKSGDTYRVTQCDQLALQLEARLLPQATGGSSAGYDLMPSSTATIDAMSLQALTPAPFGMLPTTDHLDVNSVPNPLNLFGDAGDTVVLQFDAAAGSYFLLAVEQKATRLRGNVTSDFDETTQMVTVTGIVAIGGSSTKTVVEASNLHGLWGRANDTVRIEFVPSNGGIWEIYQVNHHIVSQRIVTEVFDGTGALKETSTTLKVNGRVDPTETHNVIEYTDSCPAPPET